MYSCIHVFVITPGRSVGRTFLSTASVFVWPQVFLFRRRCFCLAASDFVWVAGAFVWPHVFLFGRGRVGGEGRRGEGGEERKRGEDGAGCAARGVSWTVDGPDAWQKGTQKSRTLYKTPTCSITLPHNITQNRRQRRQRQFRQRRQRRRRAIPPRHPPPPPFMFRSVLGCLFWAFIFRSVFGRRFWACFAPPSLFGSVLGSRRWAFIFPLCFGVSALGLYFSALLLGVNVGLVSGLYFSALFLGCLFRAFIFPLCFWGVSFGPLFFRIVFWAHRRPT